LDDSADLSFDAAGWAGPGGAPAFAIERISLADQVRNLLLEQLTSGRLRAGDRINEAELSRRLGISRNPIREAICGLAQKGFLVAVPGRGHFMRLFTPKDVNDVFSFRICVETFAIRQALPKMMGADHQRLSRLVERMFAAARDGELTQLLQADIALHRTICEISDNSQTILAYQAIDTEVQMLIASVDLDHETPLQSAQSHVPIVEALATGDVEASIAAMTLHLETTWARILKIYEDEGVGEPSGRLRPRASRKAPTPLGEH
jgi:DNA-binding GntR family transcriptional regulator